MMKKDRDIIKDFEENEYVLQSLSSKHRFLGCGMYIMRMEDIRFSPEECRKHLDGNYNCRSL